MELMDNNQAKNELIKARARELIQFTSRWQMTTQDAHELLYAALDLIREEESNVALSDLTKQMFGQKN